MKRRLMVLFLSLSAATVFAAGQKKKNAARGGGFFFFRARAPAGRRAFRCNSRPPAPSPAAKLPALPRAAFPSAAHFRSNPSRLRRL